MSPESVNSGPVLHVVVVGFHHKKGCQVEYSYPPLVPGKSLDSSDLPKQWRHLPALALPDGAHNFMEDTVFFLLPSLEKKNTAVYGVSCYRQVDSKKLVKKGTDVTRNSVQKSVCVLSCLPLFGLIQAKLELITHAYFDELDFSQTSLLQDTYNSLNLGLTESLLQQGSQVFLGLSSREMVQSLGHKMLVLFKLMLLERRVSYSNQQSSPYMFMKDEETDPFILNLIFSLCVETDLIESGLTESAKYTPSKSVSPNLQSTKTGSDSSDDFMEVRYLQRSQSNVSESRDRSGSTRSCDLPQDFDITGPADDMFITADSGCEMTSNEASGQTDPVDSSNPVNKDSVKTNAKLAENVTNEVSGDICESTDANITDDGESTASADVNKTTVDEGIGVCDVNISSDGVSSTADKCSTPAFTDPLSAAAAAAAAASEPDVKDNESSKQVKPSSSTDNHDIAETSQSMEDLLEQDDDTVTFEEDRLLLEIDAALGEETAKNPPEQLNNSTPRVHYFKHGDSIESVTPVTPEKHRDRTGSQASSSSLLSNLSAGSATVTQKAAEIRDKLTSVWYGDKDNEGFEMLQVTPSAEVMTSDHPTSIGFPLQIFTKGVLCHPYLCLQNYDLLTDVNVRGFVVGATNMLFKQKHHLLDVIFDIGEGSVTIHDAELRRQLALTTADLRFVDFLTQRCGSEESNHYLEETEWIGGNEWIRSQFSGYLSALMATVSRGDEKSVEDFNAHFATAWRSSHNYKAWLHSPHAGLDHVLPGHPFRGQLGVSDMKLKLSHTDRGKKINAAMSQTGKAVLQTGKVVGGALSSAKSAMSKTFSSWFTSSASSDGEKEEVEDVEEE